MFKLPEAIPPAGQPGGPPAESERKIMWGMPFNLRDWAVNVERHPERLIPEMHDMMEKFQRQSQQPKAAGRKQ